MDPPRGVGVYNFSESIQDKNIHFSVLRLKQSFLIWIGTEAMMKGLAVAMNVSAVRIYRS